jgi:glycosyltransferase involved in cell wall biosynthesis
MAPVPRVSVLLPTWNGAAYLDAQIGSILAQDMANLELIAIDDGSSDDTVARLAHHAAVDPRVRVLPSTGNVGQKARLMELLRAACGDVVAFADQDDVWDSAKLGRLLAAKGDRMVAFGRSEIINGAGEPQGMTLLDMLPPLPSPDDHLVYLFKPMLSAHGMVMNRAAISETAFHRTHPFDWLLSLDAAFGGGLVYVEDAVTFHRIHASNQSNGRLGRTLSWGERYAWPELRRRFAVRATERWMLVQRLEYLTYSAAVSPDLRQVFRRAHDRCVSAWFDQNRAVVLHDRSLREELTTLLRPLARTAAEWAHADATLGRLVRAPAEPVNAVRQVGSFLRGRRKPRVRT